jgi:hypothetical protein
MPDFITSENVENAKAEVVKKKGIGLLDEIRFERIREGRYVEVLHSSAYSTELESWAKMKRLMEEMGLTADGFHHEIYLPDIRRVPEEKNEDSLAATCER